MSLVWVRLLPVTLGIIVLYWPIRWLANGYPSLRTPADIAIILLLLMIPITLWATTLPGTTRPQVYRLLSGVGLFYAIINWTLTRVRLRLVVLWLALAGVVLVLIGLISVRWTIGKLPLIPSSIYEFIPTLISDLIHRNVLAGNLILILPPILGVLLFGWGRLEKLDRGIYLIATLLIISILILTQSRGALLAFVVVFFTLIIMRWRVAWIGIIGLLIICFYTVYRYGVSYLLDAISYNDSLQGLGGRVEIWSRAIYMIQDFPISGIGLGSFGKVADLLYPLFLFEPGSIPHAHNLFLQIAVDLGIPGFVSWMAVLFVVIFSSWKLFRKNKEKGDTWTAGLGAGLFASQIALVVHGLIDSVTWGMVRPAPLVWGIWGIAMVAWMGVRSNLENFQQKSI